MRIWVGSVALLLGSACGSSSTKGTAFVRLSRLSGSCAATTATGATGVDQFAGLPFTRVHAAAAFEGGSHFGSGNVIALGWQEPDGTLGRIQVDLGASRGYGVTAFPTAAPGPLPTSSATNSAAQALGYETWRSGRQTFAARKVWGVFNYVGDDTVDHPDGLLSPLQFYAHVAVDGVGAAGEALCEVVSLHASYATDRTDAYDPAWLALDVPALVVDGQGPPVAAQAPLTANLVKPGVKSDPGGDPPKLAGLSPLTLPGQGGGGDGSGDCD